MRSARLPLATVVALGLAIAPHPHPSAHPHRSHEHEGGGSAVAFGAVTLELLTAGPGRRFDGIGSVRIGATQIRGSGARPWTVGVSTSPVDRVGVADLVPYELRLAEARATPGGVDLHLNATTGPETDELVWSFRAAGQGGGPQGFDYTLRWRSGSGRLRGHKLLDRFSFGLNGTVDGRLWATQREVYNMNKGNRPSTAAAVLNSSTVLSGWDYPAQRLYPESRAAAEDPLDFLSARTASFVRYQLALRLVYKNLSRPVGSSELLCDDWHVSSPDTVRPKMFFCVCCGNLDFLCSTLFLFSIGAELRADGRPAVRARGTAGGGRRRDGQRLLPSP